jgi:hypothetical protein
VPGRRPAGREKVVPFFGSIAARVSRWVQSTRGERRRPNTAGPPVADEPVPWGDEVAEGVTELATEPAPSQELLSVFSSRVDQVDTVGPLASSIEDLGAGDRLGGFVIERVAGRGGMAVVYRARDPQLERIVALKVIAPVLAEEPSFRARFVRESRIAASIDHRCVLPVYTAGEDQGRSYIAMRFVHGRDLAACVRERGPFGLGEAVAIIAELAGALDAAHARGLVHRDVKPANALMEAPPSPRVYLTDFGLCGDHEAFGQMTQAGQRVGTAAYSAPEQLRGEPVDARADIYALGGLFYTLITGGVPFPARSEAEAVAAHLSQPPPRPSHLVPALPRGIDAVVARAMAKDPGRRYPSAGDLARAATAMADHDRLPADHGSVATGPAAPQTILPFSQARKGISRRAVGRGLLAATAVAIAAIAGASWGSPSGHASRNAAGHLDGPPIHLQGVTPNRITESNRTIWALQTGSGLLAAVNAQTRTVNLVPEPYDLGGQTRSDITAAAGSVWVTDASPSDGGVDRVSDARPRAGPLHVALPDASAVLIGARAVWATSDPGAKRNGLVVRIDPGSGQITARRTIGRQPVDMALVAGEVWVALRRAGDVLRVDPNTLRVLARVHVGPSISRLATDGEDLWVLDRTNETVTRIDTRSAGIIGTPLSLGKELQDIAAAGGSLWVAASDSTVTRVNAQGVPVGASISVGAPPLSLAGDGTGVWVASATNESLSRIGVNKRAGR